MRDTEREREREIEREVGVKKAKETQRETLNNKQKCPFFLGGGGTGFLLLEAKTQTIKNKNDEGLGPSEETLLKENKNKEHTKKLKTKPKKTKKELFNYQSNCSVS